MRVFLRSAKGNFKSDVKKQSQLDAAAQAMSKLKLHGVMPYFMFGERK
jgi:hypothetical protein